MIRTLALTLSLLTVATASAEEASWAPGAVVNGSPYQSLEELRGFYKLTPAAKTSRKGAYGLSSSDLQLEFGPGSREMRIGGIQLLLGKPLQKDTAGNLLIAREDWVKWVDPILRPTYIAGRAPVHTVVLDAGHGGHDEGTPSDHLKESDITLQMAQRLQHELEKMGLKVVLTRTGDYFLSDRQRVDTANAAEAPIFISLHLNNGRSDYRGTQVYTAAPAESTVPSHASEAASSALAYALQSALVSGAGTADGGCAEAHFSLLSSITCPSAWVELGYATHAQEGAALTTPAYQEALARALASGIATYAKVADPATGIPVQQARPAAPPKPAPPAPKPTAGKTKPAADTARSTRSSGSSRNTRRTPTRQQSTPARQQSTPTRQQTTPARQQTTPARRTRR